MRLIDADALMNDICESLNQMTNIGIAVDGEWLWGKLNDALDNAPTIEPQRMRGKWIWKGEEGDSRFSCSVCKCRENVPTCNGIPDIWDYCPNCGCQMNGDEEDEQ